MSRFNTRNTEKNQAENFAGGEAFKETPALEFISILLTSFVQDQYYRSSDDTLKRLRALIKKINDKKFVAKGAIYARNEFGMRSITHVVGGELASIVKGEPWMKNFFDKVVRRPDDMTEILAYYLKDSKEDSKEESPAKEEEAESLCEGTVTGASSAGSVDSEAGQDRCGVCQYPRLDYRF